MSKIFHLFKPLYKNSPERVVALVAAISVVNVVVLKTRQAMSPYEEPIILINSHL